MTPDEQWAANLKFLDRTITRGAEIILSTRIDRAYPGSFFDRELKYLFEQGYKASRDGSRLLPPEP